MELIEFDILEAINSNVYAKKNMNCPECDANMSIPEDAAVGEIVSCGDCGADYEISKKEGSDIELKEAETVGEDWGE